MKNLLLFCKIELVEFWIINGIFRILFSTLRGRDLRFDSLLIAASLGVILKMEMEAIKVAKVAIKSKDKALIKITGILNELPIKGTEYVYTIE